MVKRVATPKETAGGGFTFEDKVSASFLLKMLAGEFPLEPEDGQIEEVRFQKRVDGWYLDDLVLLLRRPDDSECTLAVSAKSNTQITKSGFPPDFRDRRHLVIASSASICGTSSFDGFPDVQQLAIFN